MNKHKYPYNWTLKDTIFTKDKGKVFSCFAGGGGSTMGYKLAGFDVIGCNEIDPRMMDVYIRNHSPKYSYCEPIQEFKLRDNLPKELYDLDILDGSPPCSSFSLSGNRQKDWGKARKFREGQSEQVLDTLFFDFIDLAAKLKPKVVVAENVKGLILGKARKYMVNIISAFDEAGYTLYFRVLNAADMGVPQHRERVILCCIRKDLLSCIKKHPYNMFNDTPYLDLNFDEKHISFEGIADYSGKEITGKKCRLLWDNRKYGDTGQDDANMRLFGNGSNFNQVYIYHDKVCQTLVAKESAIIHFDEPKYLGRSEVCSIFTFPQDYDFGKMKPHYVCGMSVPPVMMAQIASRVYEQWLSPIYQHHAAPAKDLTFDEVIAKMRRYAAKLGCSVGDIYVEYHEFKTKYPNCPEQVALNTAYLHCQNQVVELSSPVTGVSSTTILRHRKQNSKAFRSVSIDDVLSV